MRIPFTQVDAFTDVALAGNPAAVMPLGAWPDDGLLVRIARENNLSETAFLVPDASGAADFELRWFTPTVEVALCGHATLASGHVVLSSDSTREEVTFRTRRSGVLAVARDGAAYRLSLPALRTVPRALPRIVAALGLSGEIDTHWHADGYAIVPVANAAVVRALAPDFAVLAREGDTLVIVTAPGENSDIVSRVFAPGAGIDEDPVTGSAHAALTPYWAARLGRDSFTAHQASARGGRIACRLAGDRAILTGACVTVIEGTFLLP